MVGGRPPRSPRVPLRDGSHTALERRRRSPPALVGSRARTYQDRAKRAWWSKCRQGRERAHQSCAAFPSGSLASLVWALSLFIDLDGAGPARVNAGPWLFRVEIPARLRGPHRPSFVGLLSGRSVGVRHVVCGCMWFSCGCSVSTLGFAGPASANLCRGTPTRSFPKRAYRGPREPQHAH